MFEVACLPCQNLEIFQLEFLFDRGCVCGVVGFGEVEGGGGAHFY